MAKWGKADFSELKELNRKLEKLAKDEADDFCRECSRALAGRLLALVIPKTPVGKVPQFLDSEGNKKALKVEVQGEKRLVQIKTKNKEKLFRTIKGKRYEINTREGAILSQYWSDYKGGTLRRGWGAETKGGGEAVAAGLDVRKAGNSYIIEVCNNVEYASYVEFGHRQQPGRYVPMIGKQLKAAWVPGKHFLTISEEKLKTIAPSVLERMIRAKLEEAFE